MLDAYAIVTRHAVAAVWRQQDRERRNQHRVVDLRPTDEPDEDVVRPGEREAVARTLPRLVGAGPADAVAHEVHGEDTRSVAEKLRSSLGAVAAQLDSTRARGERSTWWPWRAPSRDRPLSAGAADHLRWGPSAADRSTARRHLLQGDLFARLSQPLMAASCGPQARARDRLRTAGGFTTRCPAGCPRHRPGACRRRPSPRDGHTAPAPAALGSASAYRGRAG